MLYNYVTYLEYITAKINGFFLDQKEYICCHKGCSKCCEKGTYPYTEIEYKLIREGYNMLNDETQHIVNENIKKTLEDKKNSNPNEKFIYVCPFLVNNSCTVYNYRGLICRIFGLMSFKPNTNETTKIPFCAYEGLNYSNILDTVNNNLPPEKFEALGLKTEPKAFNIDYKNLIDEKFGESFGFEFGKVKSLIDWFEDIG